MAGEGDDDDDFHDLARLQIEKPEVEPACGSHGGLAEQKDTDQQQDIGPIEKKTHIFEVTIIEHTNGQGDDNPQRKPVHLLDVDGRSPRGPGGGGAVQVYHANGGHQADQGQKKPVEVRQQTAVKHSIQSPA